MNTKKHVKALLLGKRVVMKGDIVKRGITAAGSCLLPGELAKVIQTYYLVIPIKDSDNVFLEAWVGLEITKAKRPEIVRTQMAEILQNVLPADYRYNKEKKRHEGGRTFDQFVAQYAP